MSGTTIAVAVEGVLLALALLFLVALLRSHAEILRRLAALDGSAGPARSLGAAGSDGRGLAIRRVTSGPAESEPLPAEAISGRTLLGDAVQLSLTGAPRTLLAFMSSGCAACGPLWDELRVGVPGLAPDLRLVVVTKDADAESPARLAELAPGGHEVVMSTAAYADFAVPVTPHFVLVDGTAGQVAGRGSAGSWEQILALLGSADADARAAATAARSSSERAARAERALAAAGVVPGHPSLYPSRAADGVPADAAGDAS